MIIEAVDSSLRSISSVGEANEESILVTFTHRMDHGLMAPEPMERLGFTPEDDRAHKPRDVKTDTVRTRLSWPEYSYSIRLERIKGG